MEAAENEKKARKRRKKSARTQGAAPADALGARFFQFWTRLSGKFFEQLPTRAVLLYFGVELVDVVGH